MSKTPSEKVAATEISEDMVSAYLREHSDYFEAHPEMLEHLALKHPSGKAVSLIERQIEVIRARNHQLQQRLASLLETARENEARVMHLNGLARVLINADSPADVMQGLSTGMKRNFGVDALFVGIKGEGSSDIPNLRYLNDGEPVLENQENFFRMGQVECGPLSAEQAEMLFSDWSGKSGLRSVALVPLGKPSTVGLLALASTDEARFQPDMGTLFLELMADLVAAALRDVFSQSGNPEA